MFRASFDLPDGATIMDAKRYVGEAVAAWHGSLRGDTMFSLDSDSVTMTYLAPKLKKPKVVE
jgi:hypothetical protein